MKIAKRNKARLIALVLLLCILPIGWVIYNRVRIYYDLGHNHFTTYNNYHPETVRKNLVNLNNDFKVSIKIVCGDHFLKESDELYLFIDNGYYKFKIQEVKFNYNHKIDNMKIRPELILIRDETVYVKHVKTSWTINRNNKQYGIDMCDSDNRIFPIENESN
jgi:hypothetical protein